MAIKSVLRLPPLPILVAATALALSWSQSAPAQVIERISVASDGTESDGDSYLGAASADGRYVVFMSRATNLVPGDTNGRADIFVRDRMAKTTTRVSVSSDGRQANGESTGPCISGDGRVVAFMSMARNLVAGDTNDAPDVFVHDRQTGKTTRVSVSSKGEQADGESTTPVISADGRYLAFASKAGNLVAGDSNEAADAFQHDRQTGETARVSVATGGRQANGTSVQPTISADGRHVAFQSSATNLARGDTNGEFDVFVHDCQTGLTSAVSLSVEGYATGGYGGYGDGYRPEAAPTLAGGGRPSISGDGRWVAFVRRLSAANNPPPPAHPPAPAGDDGDGTATPAPTAPSAVADPPQILVCDRQTGRTLLAGQWARADLVTTLSMSGDGRYLTASALPPSAAATAEVQSLVVVIDRGYPPSTWKRDTVISHNEQGLAADGVSDTPAIIADGRYVVFRSTAANLVPGDGNGKSDIFLAVNPLAESCLLVAPPVATAGQPVTFRASCRVEGAVSHRWVFGFTDVAEGETVTYSFPTGDTSYRVCLTVTFAEGYETSTCRTVRVERAP